MGRDTYFTYETLYKQYKNRQIMHERPVLSYDDWLYGYIRYIYKSPEEAEERYREAVGRHKEILDTAATGRF
jgi:hypothetical protein